MSDWSLKGTYMETCNCDAACPCVFLSDPTQGDCTVVLGWHIEAGKLGGVSLDGLNVAMAVLSPGNMAKVKWKAALYIDETASAEQQQALTNHRQLLQERDAKLEREREQLSQVGQEIRETMQSLHRRIGGDDSYWMAEEAAYLMQVAHHRLQLEWDLRTAIRALESADARLRDSGYPGWVQVRELLALEISQLKGIELADIEGVALQLSSLAAGVNQLKLLGSELPAAATSEPEVLQRTAPEERSLKTLGRDLWEGFKSIIVVRHHGQPVSALLPSDQQLLIQQHLSLQLEAARVSLLRGSQALFSTSLQNAIRLLHEHVDLDDTRSKAYLEQLTAYSKLQIRPQLPDISASLIALREQIKTLGADR